MTVCIAAVVVRRGRMYGGGPCKLCSGMGVVIVWMRSHACVVLQCYAGAALLSCRRCECPLNATVSVPRLCPTGLMGDRRVGCCVVQVRRRGDGAVHGARDPREGGRPAHGAVHSTGASRGPGGHRSGAGTALEAARGVEGAAKHAAAVRAVTACHAGWQVDARW